VHPFAFLAPIAHSREPFHNATKLPHRSLLHKANVLIMFKLMPDPIWRQLDIVNTDPADLVLPGDRLVSPARKQIAR